MGRGVTLGGVVRAVTMTAAALMLAACGTGVDAPPAPESSSSSFTDVTPVERHESTALGLVGLWRIEADGETADTWLWLGVGEFRLSRPCGSLMGNWAAAESVFLAETYGWSHNCAPVAVPWLDATVAYRATATGWELLDAARSVTAILRIDGAPPPHPETLDHYRESLPITDDVRAAFWQPTEPPPALAPATTHDLLGEWVPTQRDGTGASGVTFLPTHRYSASDGCNGSGGRWSVENEGWLITTSGPSTLIGCDGVAVPGWVASARSAAIDGEILVLFDLDGAELGRLRPAD